MRRLKPISKARQQTLSAGAAPRAAAWSRRAATGTLIVLLALMADVALGDVLAIGSIDPADDPFTIFVNEGLPFDGNGIDFNVPSPPVAADQTNFEGLSDIIVGVTAPGQLTINNGSFLRYQDLIIGDTDVVGEAGSEQTLVGEGLVRIVGVGAYYNNDPTILPSGFPPYEDFGSERPADVGYDLYVGRDGFGTLELSDGGRAEIQDAVVVGDGQLSTGDLTVDGIGSHLKAGGFSTDVGQDEIHQLIVGRLGIGFMTISNGGRVFVDMGGQTTVPDFVGAVLGGEAYVGDQAPEPGGEGYVTVTGALSRWTIRASLQIGGFHNEDGLFGPGLESEGDNLDYAINVGSGTLRVEQGGLVNVTPVDPESQVQVLTLAIGQRGRVELDGGQINVGALIGDPQSAFRNDQMRVFSDGTILGDGRIDTGIFRNRYLGEVEVGVGQRLVINASSEFDDSSTDAPPMVNWGVIRVIGNEDFTAELEFERPAAAPGDLNAPFQNLPLTVPPLTGRAGGLIHVQYGTLRFRSGIENQSAIAFTAGENLVTGDVMNLPEVSGTPSEGVISVVGSGTHVVFENDLVNEGELAIAAEADPVDVLGDFTNTGDINLVLETAAPSRLNILGIASLSGTLDVSLLGPSPIAGDEFNVLQATDGLMGIFTVQEFPPLSMGLAWLVDYNTQTDFVKLRVLSLSGAGMGVMGADFNGDGFVDLLDLAIWNMFVGITEGATPLQGDADGDGDVDGDDLLKWQMELGPVPGAGSGAGSGTFASAPEPSSLVLLLTSGVALLAIRRRKR